MTSSFPTANLPVAVSLAILYQQGKFLMQLRDDIAGILYPGHWGLFGGHLEQGESPEEGLLRELMEEIGYDVEQPVKFRCYPDARVIRHVYHAPLTISIDRLNLQEGWDVGLVTPEEVARGSCYSQKADLVKPLGGIHRQILWDFWQTHQQLICS
jgi:8-oxo-dGTP diphosphatase